VAALHNKATYCRYAGIHRVRRCFLPLEFEVIQTFYVDDHGTRYHVGVLGAANAHPMRPSLSRGDSPKFDSPPLSKFSIVFLATKVFLAPK
jgi:hypothetical protein